MTAATTSTGSSPAAPGLDRRLGYLPGLDGLRAIAVSAVFLFHAGTLSGGFVGVDVFFVISGFLITALAVSEIESTGRLGLGAFWARRARRLLPALFALCAAVVGWAIVSGEADRALRREVTTTLLYVANWARLQDGYEYFAAYDQPSLLEHTWSLAIEEQFYVVWPLLIVGAVAIGRRASWSARWTVAAVAAIGAIAAAGWSWWSASNDEALNRLYFGTDTRAVGLAVGCVAGCVLARGADTGDRRVGPVGTTVAIVGAVVLGLMTLSIDGGERWLYQLGFPVVAAASLAVVFAATGSGPVARLLSFGPLVAVGRVSYGVYLWHWPVIVILDAERTGLSGVRLGALWVVVTAALTALSWWFIERRAPLPRLRVPGRAIGYVAVGLAIGVGAIVVGQDRDTAPAVIALPTATPEPSSPEPPAPAAAEADASPAAASTATSTTPDADTSADADAQPASGDERGDEQAGDPRAAPPATAPSPASAPPEPEGEATIDDVPAPIGRPLRMLILGDSVAESLGDPTESRFTVDDVAVEVVNRSVVACPVTWEGGWAFDNGGRFDDPPACDGDDRFADAMSEVEPDLVFLLFGWSGGIAGRQLDDGTIVAPCEAGFDERYQAAYAQLVEQLSADARVVVATVAPPTEFRYESQSGRPACINAAINRLDARIFDFGDWLCPGADCTEAEPLMRDTVHFAASPWVRELVWPALVAEVVGAAGIRSTAEADG